MLIKLFLILRAHYGSSMHSHLLTTFRLRKITPRPFCPGNSGQLECDLPERVTTNVNYDPRPNHRVADARICGMSELYGCGRNPRETIAASS